jgi:hypothetical protein
MVLAAVLLGTIAVFALAYRFYGAYMEKTYNVSATADVPSLTQRDGVDYVPTRTAAVMGHHFSSIAGAGSIVGPVIAVITAAFVVKTTIVGVVSAVLMLLAIMLVIEAARSIMMPATANALKPVTT